MPKPTAASSRGWKHLPAWAQLLAERYYSRTLSTFVCHGAVRDLQPGQNAEGERRYVPLRQFFSEELFASRDYLVLYDRSSGIRLGNAEQQRDFNRLVEAVHAVGGGRAAPALPRDPGRAFPLIESFVRSRIAEGKSVAVILDYAESIAPAGDFASMGAEDRYTTVTLTRWAQDPGFLAADFSLVLVADNLSELAPRLIRSAYTAVIELPLPSKSWRLDYIQHRLGTRKLPEIADLSLEAFAELSAGLSLIQLAGILNDALAGNRLDIEGLKARKKEIIQAEVHGLLEFIEPRHDLSAVAGHDKAKELLRATAQALSRGHREVVPQGFLVAGPVGTGKTFLTTCFAGEIGIPCVRFLNFRSQWQGVTEGNLERIFSILKAMWPVAVIIDEADTALGNRSQGGDSGTSARVFGAIAAFMGNTEYRGRIVWFLLTARPDLLPIDLKRQGRAEEHLALFYPESAEEVDELFVVMAKKTGTRLSVKSPASLLDENTPPLSGADIEAALVRARRRAISQRRVRVSEEDLRATFSDFLPPSYPLEIELQTLIAVQECTSKELLPERFRQVDRGELALRIRELKGLVQEN